MTPDSTVPSDTDRLAEAPASLSDEELTLYGDLLDTTPSTWPALTWTDEVRLLTEAQRARAEVQSLQGRVNTAEGRLAKWREIHQPERRYTPDDGETSYATYAESADASFDGVGTPRSVTFFEVCSHCASLEMAEGCGHDYKESLWPCETARALGLGEGDGQ
ncbi:hypothetical protein [Glycomyces sp. NPDC021274]|uniref:hypothetical protein n=1 Tax=Glycomyces sp. NPDC021274 TaxID=3155120 RepID=UPI0033C18D53